LFEIVKVCQVDAAVLGHLLARRRISRRLLVFAKQVAMLGVAEDMLDGGG